jgi:Predicted NAD/FAD-binding protein
VQVPGALGGSGGGRTLEWSGTNLSTVFAQRTNLVNPRFLGMLRDLLRFNKLCTRIAQAQADAALMQPLGDFLSSTALAMPSATGTSCPCWAASGAAPPTRC